MGLGRNAGTRRRQNKEKPAIWKWWQLDTMTRGIIGRNQTLFGLWSKAIRQATERNRKIHDKVFEDARHGKNWLKTPVLKSRRHKSAASIYIELRLGGVRPSKMVIEYLGLERDWQALDKLLELYGWNPKSKKKS